MDSFEIAVFILCLLRTGAAPVDLSRLDRETHACPRRKLGRLPAGYFVGELNSAVQIRAQVRMSLEVTQHLRDLGGPREASRENFLWDLFQRELVDLSIQRVGNFVQAQEITDQRQKF